MKAVVYKGPKRVAVEEVPDPKIESQSDAIVRLTTSGICGSDLHMYEGRTSAGPGIVLGHENMGVIEAIGQDVQSLKVGDRVVLPFNIACGFCFNCARGFTNACLTENPESFSAGYGYVGMGPHRGGQAELLRVPHADVNCLKLPGKPGDALEDDFLLLSDVFPTGYHAAELAHVIPGSTVAVFGAGPVGLLAAYSSILKGATEVYVVDKIEARLKKAQEIGAIPIDFTKGDPVEQIKQRRRVPPGEEKMDGVMCGIDAVGYEAFDFKKADAENPSQVLDALSQIVNPTGHVGIVGVYLSDDPRAVNEKAKKGVFEFPFGEFWEKGIELGLGQTPVKRYNFFLRDLIIAGKAKPSFIVSHRLPLQAAPDAYKKFDERVDGYTKVLLKPKAA
jgi:glutathione-independent formaldehyde dehydrogenase